MIRSRFPDRQALEAHQFAALRKLIDTLLGGNRFYAGRIREAGLDGDLGGIDDYLRRMPLTTKQQIVKDQLSSPPYGTNLTYPLEKYTRYCQTSGTTGSPIRWLDTHEGWQWMLENWKQVYHAAGVTQSDRTFFAFSFGPFLGFWTAFESALQLGLLSVPGGGMSSTGRLSTILDNQVTILCCTPTYAIHLAEVAAEQNIDLSRSHVRRIIVAGEPGGSVPATRKRIELLWPGALVFDHHGMTEVGPVSFENPERNGFLHIIEASYLAEIIDSETQEPVPAGETGELVLTTLGRAGSPLLRYRTGDLVRQSILDSRTLGRVELALEGGILGRTDDMVLVRGVNVYPSGIDQVVRAENDVAEYRVEVLDAGTMTELKLILEPRPTCEDRAVLCRRVAATLRDAFQLRVPVSTVPPGALPRFEMKAKRWIKGPSSPSG